MSVYAKIVIDVQEYDRLQDIARKYASLIHDQNGKGCNCQSNSSNFSETIAHNDQEKGLYTPLPQVTSPITDATKSDSNVAEIMQEKNSIKQGKKGSWYFIGKP